MPKRKIEDVLKFRTDISPFLVHLTRDTGDGQDIRSAEEALKSILEDRLLTAGDTEISDARFGGKTYGLDEDDRRDYFCAVSLSETPLNEVHCLLEIQRRRVNLRPYGLVFLKEDFSSKGVSPVLYINNNRADKDQVFRALFCLTTAASTQAKELLPLVSVFGQTIKPPSARNWTSRSVDWRWEREWRYPASRGDLTFTPKDVFLGLCPQNKIRQFEDYCHRDLHWPYRLRFIDPRRNMKWYAKKLIEARQRVGLKVSVV